MLDLRHLQRSLGSVGELRIRHWTASGGHQVLPGCAQVDPRGVFFDRHHVARQGLVCAYPMSVLRLTPTVKSYSTQSPIGLR